MRPAVECGWESAHGMAPGRPARLGPVTALPAAVLWDMDGTLVDTEPYWMAAETELVHSFGGTWTHDDALTLVGGELSWSAGQLQRRGVDLSIDEIVPALTARVQQQLAEIGVPWRPGAQELLRELREASVRTALVTMSYRRMAEQIASYIPFEPFDAIIAGDEVVNGKPHPEAYLTAAARLGVDAARCVAIEDSLTGLAAAVASGAMTIGVPHLVPLPESDEHTLWPTLAGRTVDDIRALASGRFRDAAR